MAFEDIKIRCYHEDFDRARVEDLERTCEVGPSERVFLFTDTMGDPICRIRNSPMYMMLVAELDNKLVGVIQGSIKVVTIQKHPKDQAKVGYILGLRVSPVHRRKGIGSSLVHRLEEWFITNQADFAYMATEKDNKASVKLFMEKHGFTKFRTPSILVNPVGQHSARLRPDIHILELKVEQAEFLYREFMGSTEFFPHDIDKILRNKLSLGTWVAYRRGETDMDFGSNGPVLPSSWAMLSVWNSGELFKLKVGKAPISCMICAKSSRVIDRVFRCLRVPSIPNFFDPFGFYFLYGVHREGPSSSKLMKTLCQFVHNMATTSQDIRVIVTEVGGEEDTMRAHIPHSKLLSFPEDLWCIKSLKNEERNSINELTKAPPLRPLFVDPREV